MKSLSAGSTRPSPASSNHSPASSASSRRVASGGAVPKTSTRLSYAKEPSTKRSISTDSLSHRVGSGEDKSRRSADRSGVKKGGRPSDVLNPKTVDPFKNSKSDTPFADVYNSGGVPCRLAHGSVKHKLSWTTPPDDVHFDPVLITLAEGIRETLHPYTFVARTGFKELLQCVDAEDKTRPILSKLVHPLRGALTHSDPSVFDAGLDALGQLSVVAGPDLNPHLKTLLPAVSKRALDKKYKEHITQTLHILEQYGGKDSLPVIKSKVPTYTSISS